MWTVIAVLALVFVPTAATLFANEVSTWDWALRLTILGLWLIPAVAVVHMNIRREDEADRQFKSLTGRQKQQRKSIRRNSEQFILKKLLTDPPRKRPLQGYEFNIYEFRQDTSQLVPVWPTDLSTDEIQVMTFAVGTGATGRAWDEEVLIVVQGDDVSSERYGLTDFQRQRWIDYQVVLAAPIWLDATEKVGVLTAISKKSLTTVPEGNLSLFKEYAEVVGATYGDTLREMSHPADKVKS